MVFFAKNNVTIYEQVRSAIICGLDQYDNPKKCLSLVERTSGDLQPGQPSTTLEDYGQTDQSDFTLILPVNSEITKSSKVEVEGYEGYFTVMGTPKLWNTLIPHIECRLTKDR